MALARFIVALFSRCGKWSSRWSSAEPNPAHALGRRGERLAEACLRRYRYKVLYRNFRAPGGGEIDLVCRDRQTRELVFVEVKTRTSIAMGRPGEAVRSEKQALLIRGARAWLRLLGDPAGIPLRFDVVEVLISEGAQPEITILKNAFQVPEHLRL